MELKCKAQNYAWGKMGLESQVAKLLRGVDVDANAPYAELWMGVHPNGPSEISESGQPLSAWLDERGEKSLPYLLKVLSVAKALSIQAHPDKKAAEKLHAERPLIYKDDNHKPEMAIALTPFEALCGFRPIEDIRGFMKTIPELRNVIGDALCDDLIQSSDENYPGKLKAAFTGLMKADKDLVAENVDALSKKIANDESNLSSLLKRLIGDFPGDVGIFVAFFANFVKLDVGEALFLGPNLLHAYISGDCVECMANSDNVVRAGLTPKLIDVDTLCEMLVYESSDSVKFQPKQETDECLVYDPPVEDFTVARFSLSKSKALELKPRKSTSILIVIEGSGSYGANKKPYFKGTILVIAPKDVVNFKSKEDTLMYQAFC